MIVVNKYQINKLNWERDAEWENYVRRFFKNMKAG